MGLAVSWEPWDIGLIPSQAQWVKDPALPQLWLGWQLQLRSDPWPGNSMCCRKEERGGGQSLLPAPTLNQQTHPTSSSENDSFLLRQSQPHQPHHGFNSENWLIPTPHCPLVKTSTLVSIAKRRLMKFTPLGSYLRCPFLERPFPVISGLLAHTSLLQILGFPVQLRSLHSAQ